MSKAVRILAVVLVLLVAGAANAAPRVTADPSSSTTYFTWVERFWSGLVDVFASSTDDDGDTTTTTPQPAPQDGDATTTTDDPLEGGGGGTTEGRPGWDPNG